MISTRGLRGLDVGDKIGLAERHVAHPDFLALAWQRNVGGQQIIRARQRHAVSGKEHERDVAGFDGAREPHDVIDDLCAVEILAADHVEAELLQRAAHGAGIVDGLLQLPVGGKIGIAVVADDQRDAVLRFQFGGSEHGQS